MSRSSVVHAEPVERAASACTWALGVTLAMGACARLPWPTAAGTGVTMCFFGAVWWAVWRREDAVLQAHGLTLGGMMCRAPVRASQWLLQWGRALGWATLLSVVVLLPFALLWRPVIERLGIGTPHAFRPQHSLETWGSLVATHLLVVALAEESFYRGVLQTRFERSFPRGWNLFGAPVSGGNVLTSLVFAVGHVVTRTDPAHLLVFFPSLLFGWLRTRTRGVEAGIFFHAFCNLMSEALFDGYMG